MTPLLLLLAAPALFEYNSRAPLELRTISTDMRASVQIQDITFANASGGRTAAYLVSPNKPGLSAGVLFVHWYEPESKDSNRTQFLEQALELARSGTVSLLIETMWSQPDWFPKRNRVDDFANSVKQVKELRRALDVLLATPGVDRRRIAYVGHDFGAMYGTVLAGVDRRVKAWALQAGTTSFSDWFLLGVKADAAARAKVVDELAPLDPVKFIGLAAPAPVLLQFGRSDQYVSESQAQALYAAAREPREIKFYDSGHGLNAAAVQDRQAWLKLHLRLR